MKSSDTNWIYYVGIVIWICISRPLISLSTALPILILGLNLYLTGNDDVEYEEEFAYNNSINRLHSNTFYISAALFALAAMLKDYTPKPATLDVKSRIIVLMLLVIFFSDVCILPLIMITGYRDTNKINQYNGTIIKVKNVCMTFAIGFFLKLLEYLYTQSSNILQ